MNVDALVLVLVAFADLALVVQLRRRRNRRKRLEGMTTALRLALRRANAADTMRTKRPLCRAS